MDPEVEKEEIIKRLAKLSPAAQKRVAIKAARIGNQIQREVTGGEGAQKQALLVEITGFIGEETGR